MPAFIQSLAQLAARFKGFLGIVALLLVVGAGVMTTLFSRGSFDQVLPGFLGLAPDQRFVLFLLALLLPCAIIVLLILLSYRHSAPHPQRAGGVITVLVHAHGDETSYISGAEVRLALPNPLTQPTSASGTTQFRISSEDLGRAYALSATKAGFQSPRPAQVKLADQAFFKLPLRPERAAPGAHTPNPPAPAASAPDPKAAPDPPAAPFIVGPPVPPERFYGRAELRSRLAGWLGGSPPQSCMIVGLYRSGKSSLLRYIRERPDEFFRPQQRPLVVALDFAEATCQTPAGVIESLRRALGDQLGAAPWPPSADADPHAVKAALERLRDQGYRLVVLIDEFQSIVRNADSFTRWGGDWRSKMQSGSLTCVIASLRPVGEVYRQAGQDSPFGNDLRDATLGAIEPDAWPALVRAGMRAAGRAPAAADLDLIDDLAGGLPFYTQLAGETLLGHPPAAVRAAFAAAAAPHFADLWRTLKNSELHALRFAAGLPRLAAPQPGVAYALRTCGLLRPDDRPFSSAFAAFVRDQR